MDLENPPKLDHGIPDPETFLPGPPDWIWWTYGAGTIVFLFLIWLSLRRALRPARRSRSGPAPDFLGRSRKAIQSLESKCDDLPLAQIAARASLAIRSYLAGSFSEPALFETTEEFQARQGTLPRSVNQFLNELSDAKYARSTVDGEKARSFLKRSNQSLAELAEIKRQELEVAKESSSANQAQASPLATLATGAGYSIPLGLTISLAAFLTTGFQIEGAEFAVLENYLFWIGLAIALLAAITSLFTRKHRLTT